MQFNAWNTIANMETGTAASGASAASELSRANTSRDGKTIHNTGSVDLHVLLITERDVTAAGSVTGTIVSTGRMYVIPAGYTLTLEVRGQTRIFLAAASGTCTFNAMDVIG